MDNKGIHIRDIYNPRRYSHRQTIIDWDYDGPLDIKPRPIWVCPALKNEYDAQSFALATLLPLAAVTGGVVTFPTPVPKQIVDFWQIKMAGLERFFKQPLKVKIQPTSNNPIEYPVKGNDIALFYGGGYDSVSTIGKLLDKGLRPRLVRIHYAGYHGDLPNHIRYRLMNSLAKANNLPFVTPSTNCIPVQWDYRGILGQFIEPASMIELNSPPHKKYGKRAADLILAGFQFFFTALAVLPDSVGQIIMASSKEDQGEQFGLGFNAAENSGYLGLKMITNPWETKVEQYDYVHNHKSDLRPWIKSCDSEELISDLTQWVKCCASSGGKLQWCGKCRRCTLSYLLQLAVRAPDPIVLSPQPSVVQSQYRLGFLKTGLEFYKQNGPIDEKVIVEFKKLSRLKI